MAGGMAVRVKLLLSEGQWVQLGISTLVLESLEDSGGRRGINPYQRDHALAITV